MAALSVTQFVVDRDRIKQDSRDCCRGLKALDQSKSWAWTGRHSMKRQANVLLFIANKQADLTLGTEMPFKFNSASMLIDSMAASPAIAMLKSNSVSELPEKRMKGENWEVIRSTNQLQCWTWWGACMLLPHHRTWMTPGTSVVWQTRRSTQTVAPHIAAASHWRQTLYAHV